MWKLHMARRLNGITHFNESMDAIYGPPKGLGDYLTNRRPWPMMASGRCLKLMDGINTNHRRDSVDAEQRLAFDDVASV